MFFGLFLIIIGVIFLLENIGVITGDVWKYIWPSLIILLGFSVLIKPSRGKFFGWGKWQRRDDETKNEENK